jgi:hypothetical protein
MPRPERETPEYAAMLRRMIRAYEARLAHSNPDDLREALSLCLYLENGVGHAIRAMREHYDYSWQTIGNAIGTTRQAAFQRFGAQVESPEAQTTRQRAAAQYRKAVEIQAYEEENQ